MSNQQRFFDQVDKRANHFIDRLKEAVSIPSVSGDEGHADDVRHMQTWLERKLESLGVKLGTPPSEVPSLVLGHIGGAHNAKTVLVYGHYDVQPANKQDWAQHNPSSPDPFAPTRLIDHTTDKLVGRGTTDDKGPVTAWLNVLEAHNDINLELPVTIRFLFEGMEEVGNDKFEPWIKAEAQKPNGFFAGIHCVCVADNYWFNARHPSLAYGLRGLVDFNVTITGAKDDLHSGIYGRMIHEPMTDLINMLGKLVDTNGVIKVKGVEDLVPPPTDEEREQYQKLGYKVEDLRKETGAHVELSEDPVELLMGRMRYPSLSIHGIDGGRVGTIIPRKVTGRFSLRLVQPQTYEDVKKLVTDYLYQQFKESKSLNTIEVNFEDGANPWIGDKNHWNYQAAYEAIKTVWGEKLAPFYVLEGGSVPLVFTLQEALPGKPSVMLMPMGRSDDGAHSLSEKLDILNYINGTKVYGAYFYEIAKH